MSTRQKVQFRNAAPRSRPPAGLSMAWLGTGLALLLAGLVASPARAAVDCSVSPDYTVCDDGDACTFADLCIAGACVPGPGCNACERCETGVGCLADVRPACSPAGPGLSAITVKPRKPYADNMLWTWRSPAGLPAADFGDPLTATDYAICVFDRHAGSETVAVALEIPAGGTCKNRPCWTAKHDGFRFKKTTPNRVQLKMDPGTGKDGQIRLSVRRGWLRDVGPPYAQDPNVLVQFRTSDAGCWEATYSESSRNIDRGFRAHSD